MSGQETPQYLALVALLSDGAWHRLADAVRVAGRAVTPGVALRHAQSRLEMKAAMRQAAGMPGDVKTRPASQLIAAGQRSLALIAINSSRRIERTTIDGATYCRLLPPVLHHNTRKRLAREREAGSVREEAAAQTPQAAPHRWQDY